MGATIRGEGVRENIRAGNPRGTEGMSAGGGGRGGERHGFSPAGGAVNHCEDVSVTLEGGRGLRDLHGYERNVWKE